MTYLVGIDFGTTNVKAAAYDLSGRALSLAVLPTPVVVEGPGRAVYPADRVWETAASVLRRLAEQGGDPQQVAAIATTSVGESVVPVGEDGAALAPALAWYDDRTFPMAKAWSLEAANIFRTAGSQVEGIFSAFKALWFKREHPELYRRTRHWLPIGDFLNFKLCGRAAVCSSLASRTLLFDLPARRWSEDLMTAFGLDPSQWPEVVEAGTPLGGVSAEAAAQTGLLEGTPVVAGGHDHICGALAAGAYVPGIVLDSMGTTEAIFATLAGLVLTEEARRLGYSMGCHVVPGRYYAINGILGSGGLLDWLRRNLWSHVGDDAAAFAQLEAAAAASGEGAHDLVVLPYFAGPGLAHPEPDIRGAVLGLTLSHTAGDLARAALESLCFEVRLMLSDLSRLLGEPARSLRLIGGASRNALWRRLKSDLTGYPVSVPDFTEAGCLGSALLAGLGVGLYRDPADAVARVYRESQSVAPDAAAGARYEPLFRRFVRLREKAGKLGRWTHTQAKD